MAAESESPIALGAITLDLPEALRSTISHNNIITVEQLYIYLTGNRGVGEYLGLSGSARDHLVSRLEALLSPAKRAALQRADKEDYLASRPLGVLPPASLGQDVPPDGEPQRNPDEIGDADTIEGGQS
jgi:hypothetical protein